MTEPEISNAGGDGERKRDGAKEKTSAKLKKRGSKKRGNIYEEVTAKIIAELEAGRFPWAQPWVVRDEAAHFSPGLPKNAATGANYTGINILLLWGAAIETARTTQVWLTFKQALALGGNVRKGERGATICYADSFIPKKEQERAASDGEDPRRVGFLKRYTVFNIDQCEGLAEELYAGVGALPECEMIPRAENLIKATGADFRVGGDKALYVPSKDFICVPPQPAFFDQINYYRTCFHELGHWTGHKSRLDRNMKSRAGAKDYAREELVAELSSAFVCASLSITPTVRHADYLGSWLEVLREDNRAIFSAASKASKAASFILAFEANENTKPQTT